MKRAAKHFYLEYKNAIIRKKAAKHPFDPSGSDPGRSAGNDGLPQESFIDVTSLRRLQIAVFPAPEMLLGLALAQVIATLQVHASNLSLFAKMTAVAAAGFQPVPSATVLPRLAGFEAAFGGGILFTLSVGAGISLSSMAAAWLWDRFLRRRRFGIASLIGLWAVVLLGMNRQGFDLWVALYFAVIPPPVFTQTLKYFRVPGRPGGNRFWLSRGIPIAGLALVWFTQYDRSLFIDVRDHLLLSNPFGVGVSSFYYRYTLYPAEVFKPLQQRQIKAVVLTPAGHSLPPDAVARKLIQNDYLPVTAGSETDLEVERQEDRLRFVHRGVSVMDIPVERFLSAPHRTLEKLSSVTDRWEAFRGFTFWCVLLAFPIAIYTLAFGCLRLLAGLILRERVAELVASGVCLMIGLGIFVYYFASRESISHPEEVEAALRSEIWQKQTAALKAMHEYHLDVCDFPGRAELGFNPHPQVRYWLGRAWAESRCAQASAELLRLLEDPHLNVRNMALEGLAQRSERSAVGAILRNLQGSQEWYEQFYAYRALKALGWKQPAFR
jgi:hypothetical protein